MTTWLKGEMARPPSTEATIIIEPEADIFPSSVSQQPKPSSKELCRVCTHLENATPRPACTEASACICK